METSTVYVVVISYEVILKSSKLLWKTQTDSGYAATLFEAGTES